MCSSDLDINYQGLGAENIELHAAVAEDEVIMKEWEIVNKSNPSNYNSMCLDRLHMGNFGLENRIKQAKEYSGEKLIIQADGYPMSGGEDDYNTTLQAVATADVNRKDLKLVLVESEIGLSEARNKLEEIRKVFFFINVRLERGEIGRAHV